LIRGLNSEKDYIGPAEEFIKEYERDYVFEENFYQRVNIHRIVKDGEKPAQLVKDPCINFYFVMTDKSMYIFSINSIEQST
jgi:hypothetical protein